MSGQLDDMREAWRIASRAADRFRDVATEVLGLDDNPGDDALIAGLRAMAGRSGPERTRWRDTVSEAESSGAIRGLST